jgi:SAM-dependent methyltransferase
MNGGISAARPTEVRPREESVLPVRCPACGNTAAKAPLETLSSASLYACGDCDLHFWHPIAMPGATWYETAYRGRDQMAMPLEPGHRFFLSDPKAPKRGRLLDLGCGVGNFLAAARDAGLDVTGIEINQNAVRFAQEHYGLRDVLAMRPEEFLAGHPQAKFDVVTFFEVLEHQESPQGFLHVAKKCLAPHGFIALSVPNRNRWQKGADPADYPPNHLTRWSPSALRRFLERNGFEVLSLREEPLSVLRAAQVLSTGLRMGFVSRVAGERPPTLTDLAELNLDEMKQKLTRLEECAAHRLAARLARWKNYVLAPAAAMLLPFLRLRGYTGLYLYCLAQLNHPAKNGAGTVRACG